jgi:hypothetical protein
MLFYLVLAGSFYGLPYKVTLDRPSWNLVGALLRCEDVCALGQQRVSLVGVLLCILGLLV